MNKTSTLQNSKNPIHSPKGEKLTPSAQTIALLRCFARSYDPFTVPEKRVVSLRLN